MKAFSIGTTVAVLAAVLLLDTRLPADTPTTGTAQAQRQAQERARTMARELVTGVLDTQLTKLEVNGLERLPIYGEIKAMRKNIDRLVETEMGAVIALLAQAQALPESQREQKYDLVRAKTRDIVVRLSIERQHLLRRLKLADMAAQVRRQIEMQTANLRRTETLTVDKPAQAVATIQHQRDLKALYGQVVYVVRDVSTWGGLEGATAADGLRILRAGQVSEELDKAQVALESAKFDAAAVSEKAVLKGLAALLEKVEEARGLTDHDVAALLKEIAQLTKRQEEVKDKTRKEELSGKTGDELHERQEQIHKDLDKLNEGLARIPGAKELLEQAKAAAFAAKNQIFEAKRTEAVQSQEKTLTNLKGIAEELKKATDQANAAKSADELARQLEHLKAAGEAMKAAEPHQEAAFDKKAKDDAAAKKSLAELRKQLDKARGEPELPPAVTSRLNEAKEAVDRAQEKLADPEARKEAKEAVERANAEVHAAIAETERRQLAVKIGELGRAAEALERAAVHQRDLAEKAADAAKKGGFTSPEAKELQKEQQEAIQVAAKTAEGVKETAPKAAEKLNEAAAPLKKVDAELGAEKPTAKSTEAVGQEARKAAKKLEEAAAQIRKDIGATAQELTRVADKQLAQIGEAAKEVEKARSDLPPSDAEKMEELARARKLIEQAQTEQQRANGQEKAAKLRELAQKIGETIEQQQRADRAADDLKEGKTARTAEAIAAQQKTADDAGELAKMAKDKVGEALEKAEKAAAKAAKALHDGKANQAEEARKETRSSLEKAQQEARAQADKAATEEVGKPNAEAQKRVGELSQEAAKKIPPEAPGAAKALEKASEQAKKAEQQIASATPAKNAQKAAEDALREADRQIQKAMQESAERQAHLPPNKGEQIAKAAEKTSKVDPDALAALRSAEKKAQALQGEKAPMPATPEGQKAAIGKVQETRAELEKAATSLEGRKLQAERDKALAEEVGQAAAQQQKAREQIDTSAQELAKTEDMHKDPAKTDNADPKAAKAANELQKAQKDFADTQRKIGENAKEISRQEQLANKPLREALEGASKLAKPQETAKAPEGKTPETKPGEGMAKTEPKPGEGMAKTEPKPGEGMPKPGEGMPKPGEGMGQPKNAELGTGFVPSSAEQTAKMIAGDAAQKAAAQANPGQPGAQVKAPGQPTPGQPTPGAPMDTKESTNPYQGGPMGNKANSTADSNAKAKMNKEEPWMAKLPPELRKAIQANSLREAPRGYEELLRRYFQGEE